MTYQPSSILPKNITIFAYYVSVPAFLILGIWLGINSGPWVLKKTPHSFVGWLHYFRTAFPLIVVIYSSIALMDNKDGVNTPIIGPFKAWIIYGGITLITCINSPRPIDAIYWALNYLAVLTTIAYFLTGSDRLLKAVHLNYLNWIVTSLFLTILVFFARDVLFVDYRYGWLTGYGVVNRVGDVAGMAMSRSSGMARFAAVPGIVAFVFFLNDSAKRRFFWIIPFFLSAFLIWAMQSRGAILGFGFAIAFILLFLGPRSRLFGIVGLMVVGLLYFTDVIPDNAAKYIKRHFYRGQNYEQLKTLTGRTRAWRNAWYQIKKAPIMGRGPQADRYYIKEHVHNTYLYALLQSGFLGTAAFVGGLVWAWILFFQAILKKTAAQVGQHNMLMQAGGILAFFTVRSIPEVCGAMFGVDLMVMAPILAYLTVLSQHNSVLNNNPEISE